MAHKYEHVSTGGGFSVTNNGTKTTLLTQAGKVSTDIVETASIEDDAVTNAKLTAPKIGVIQETVLAADLVDGTSTVGTHTFTAELPAGAVVTQSTISELTGFAGDTSAVVTVGDGSDVDRYNTGTPNVFTTAAHISAGAVSGTAYNLTAVAPVITVTSDSDIGLVIADASGSMVITLFYYTV